MATSDMSLAEQHEPILCALDLIVMADRGDVKNMEQLVSGIKLNEIADLIGSLSYYAVLGMYALAQVNGLDLGGQVESLKAAMTANVQDGQE